MVKTAIALGANGENFFIALPNISHFRIGDVTIIERHAPIRTALKNSQGPNLIGNITNDLNAARARADNPDAFACQIQRLMRPIIAVEARAFKFVHTLIRRHGRGAQCTGAGDHKAACQFIAIFKRHCPDARALVPFHLRNRRVEADVFVQVKFISNEIQIFQIFRLRREHLFPVPFIEQIARKFKAVSVAFAVEPAPRIAVIVPRTAKPAACLQHQCRDPHIF